MVCMQVQHLRCLLARQGEYFGRGVYHLRCRHDFVLWSTEQQVKGGAGALPSGSSATLQPRSPRSPCAALRLRSTR